MSEGRVAGELSVAEAEEAPVQEEKEVAKAFYNAQCCGVAFEFQTFNFSGYYYYPGYRPPVTVDRRFAISFTLAGLGTFSNFFGALGGTPR